MVKLSFYSDAGHGWLAVSRAELSRLGIADKVSRYSYQRGDTVYLEEDCDAMRYVNAMGGADMLSVTEIDHGSRSPIRSYQRYQS